MRERASLQEQDNQSPQSCLGKKVWHLAISYPLKRFNMHINPVLQIKRFYDDTPFARFYFLAH
jgi:hypothetical protein